jgi:hypothetical protein
MSNYRGQSEIFTSGFGPHGTRDTNNIFKISELIFNNEFLGDSN